MHLVHRLEGKNPIGEADLKWIFARNLPCIRKEAPGEVPVGVRALNSYGNSEKFRKKKIPWILSAFCRKKSVCGGCENTGYLQR